MDVIEKSLLPQETPAATQHDKAVELVQECDDNPNTTQTLEYTKDKYNAKIIK
jgi:hypothetical protein